ncbi:MAG: hypothetical protein GXP29_02515, partial [Planctomycetes bacterium]|nr:hypothetical protein [Planctomycetota bacterium]
MINLYATILSIVLAAGGLDVHSPQLEAAARTDAVRQVMDQVYACRSIDGSTLSDAIVSPSVDLRLRQLIRNRCKVTDLNLTPPGPADGLSDALHQDRRAFSLMVQLATADLPSDVRESKDDLAIKKILNRLEHRSFVTLGVSDPRLDPAKPQPLGWETVTSNGTAMAVDIARDDALRQLTAACDRAFAGDLASSAYRTHIASIRTAIESSSPQLHDEQVCTVTVPYQIKDSLFNAVGYGVPPWSQVWRASGCIDRAPPSWASQTLVATGRGGIGGSKPSDAESVVARSAAKANALLKLATRVDELPLPQQGSTTMGEWLRA